MALDIVKGHLFGTYVIINGERKHTYGYKFTNIYNKKGEFALWYCLLVYLIKNKYGVSSSDVYDYIHFCNKKCIQPKSNHDLLTALKNCGFIDYVRVNKTTHWFATDKAKEYLTEIINKQLWQLTEELTSVQSTKSSKK